MKKAIAITTHLVRKRLRKPFTEACLRHDIKLDFQTTYANYKAKIKLAPNIITWGVKMPSWWYKRTKKNFLYVENGLFSQKEGIWVDAGGWFADSDLSKGREWEGRVSRAAKKRIVRITNKWKWDYMGGSDPEGPILYAVQRRRDAPCLYHFPAQDKSIQALLSGIKILSEHAPDRKVLIRPHPRYHNEWKAFEVKAKKYFRPDWEVDRSKNVYELLPKCSALVTVNSTLATEALVLGMPVATLGRGAFTGSNVTLECSEDPTKLKGLLEFKSSTSARLGYLAACMRHQIPYRVSTKELAKNKSFQKWAERCV